MPDPTPERGVLAQHALDGKCQRPNCIVVHRRRMRDWWRRSYWAICIYCNAEWGPMVTKEGAQAKADLLNEWQSDHWEKQ